MTVLVGSGEIRVGKLPQPRVHPFVRVAFDLDKPGGIRERLRHGKALERQRDVVERGVRIVVLGMRVVQDRIVRGDLDLLADTRSLHPRGEHAVLVHQLDRLRRIRLTLGDVLQVNLDVRQTAVVARGIDWIGYGGTAIVLVLRHFDGFERWRLAAERHYAFDRAAVRHDACLVRRGDPNLTIGCRA